MMPVNEVSGYRKFGGCLDAYMDAHLEPNMMETSKQSERTIKSSSYSVQNSYIFVHLKLYIERRSNTMCGIIGFTGRLEAQKI